MRKWIPLLASLALMGASASALPAASAAPRAVQGPIGCTTLSQGDDGFPVRVLQGDLAQLGLYGAAVTGVFDAATARALGRFQGAHGLSATGVLDAATLSAIEGAMGIAGPGPSCGGSASGTSPTSGSPSTGGGSMTATSPTSGGASTGGGTSASDTGSAPGTASTSGGTSASGTGSARGGASTGGGAPAASPSTPGTASSSTGTSGSASGSGSSTANPANSGASASGFAATANILAISPRPRVAIDYEYASANGVWNSGFALGGSCAQQSAYGAWDARNGYGGLVLDLGDPLGLQTHAGSLARAKSMLKTAETCFAQGFASVAPHAQPVIYIGFSNCIPAAGASRSCGSSATSTSRYARAGTVAAGYVTSGTANVKGGWGDFESDWSTLADVHAEMLAYMSANPAKGGQGQWCDSTYRNYQPGLPNSTWTVSSMLALYVSPLVQGGYSCLGSHRMLIPQAYVASWLANGAGNFSPASSLAAYVGGITVCGTSASLDRCPDLAIPAPAAGKAQKWTAYLRDGYASAASSVLAVVAGSRLKISLR